jgi:hypothetical protein
MPVTKIYDPFKETTYEIDSRGVSRWRVRDYLVKHGYDPLKYRIRCGCIHLSNNSILNHYADLTLTIYANGE